MPLPQERLYTTNDIYTLPEGTRAELIDGRIYYMALPSRKHQEIAGELFSIIRNYIVNKGGSCKPYIAPFAVFLNTDDKTMWNRISALYAIKANSQIKAVPVLQTGLLKLSRLAADEWIISPNFLNIVLPVSGNTGLLIRTKIEYWFTTLKRKIPETIPSLIQSKPVSILIFLLTSHNLISDCCRPCS